jgi:hypothetical protein
LFSEGAKPDMAILISAGVITIVTFVIKHPENAKKFWNTMIKKAEKFPQMVFGSSSGSLA